MVRFYRAAKSVMIAGLAMACGGLAVMWPDWRANLRAQSYYDEVSIEVPVDIKPQSCPNPFNLKSRGVLSVAVLGSEDLDVSSIDPASILLEGVPPLRWNREDVAPPYVPFTGKEEFDDCTEAKPDGREDLSLKFDMQEFASVLDDVEDGEVIVLSLIGNLKDKFDGLLIEGEDVAIIRKKGKR